MDIGIFSNGLINIYLLTTCGSIILLLAVILVFWRNYSNYKSVFAQGLLLLAFLFLIEQILGIVSVVLYNESVNTLMILADLIEFSGFLILLRIVYQ